MKVGDATGENINISYITSVALFAFKRNYSAEETLFAFDVMRLCDCKLAEIVFIESYCVKHECNLRLTLLSMRCTFDTVSCFSTYSPRVDELCALYRDLIKSMQTRNKIRMNHIEEWMF